jgi:pimeloyl-ACP methyl ester carboxylesterase
VRSLLEPAAVGAASPVRIVLLPGAYQLPEDCLAAGFLDALRQRGLPIDLCLVDLDLRHLTDRGVLARLRQEIIAPARAAGCRTIWLAGISLGAYIALEYASSYTQEIGGLCLLSPYLGSRILCAEIARAGGLDAWTPGEIAVDDADRQIWQRLKTWRESLGLVYLGYGRQDRFVQAHELLAAALPPALVDVQPGHHDWDTWLRLWGKFLDSVSL